MKFHATSFLLGLAGTTLAFEIAPRLRPVAVEAAALSGVLLKTGRVLLERQLEWFEDLWMEIDERLQERMRGQPPASSASSPNAAPSVHS